ncbi:sulfotransferase family 2 domain-containing protein [Metapseudomonas resinovorans]|uniref:sulfotransferase family 2 domain-containing protein n=1 Tax=Metapseudomonas resinovorans TaxID=53412 RepID=UPI0003F76D0C|nr:sulfotransferase family 2 domain-containing protein [Pseudomonas resinovorans]
MIISHKHKFIFIKTRKTAGTSIEAYLSPLCGDADIFTPIKPHVSPHLPRNHEGFFNHIPAHKVRDALGQDIWDSYFKFCVERNPWDKMASFYHFINKFRYSGELSLEQFFESKYSCSDVDKYTEPTNHKNIMVDKIIRYEELKGGLHEVFDRLEIPFNGNLGIYAKSEFRDDRRHYTEFFNKEQLNHIQNEFSREIDLHGYQL